MKRMEKTGVADGKSGVSFAEAVAGSTSFVQLQGGAGYKGRADDHEAQHARARKLLLVDKNPYMMSMSHPAGDVLAGNNPLIADRVWETGVL